MDLSKRLTRRSELERFYLEMLTGQGMNHMSLAKFHLDRLEDYWTRWLGFLKIRDAIEIDNDAFLMIEVGSALAHHDIVTFLSEGKKPFLTLWFDYTDRLKKMHDGGDQIEKLSEQCYQILTKLKFEITSQP